MNTTITESAISFFPVSEFFSFPSPFCPGVSVSGLPCFSCLSPLSCHAPTLGDPYEVSEHLPLRWHCNWQIILYNSIIYHTK